MKQTLLYLLLITTGLSLFSACRSTEERQLRQMLQQAGSNRAELEKALHHYERCPADSLKQQAICFLIRNIGGSWGTDSSILPDYRSIYRHIHKLSEQYDGDIYSLFGEKTDSVWNNQRAFLPAPQAYRYADIQKITAGILIRETDLAFRAWQNNVYTCRSSFEDFCEYILPYRRYNGLIIDNARSEFNRRHPYAFTTDSVPFRKATDSLLSCYRSITHNAFRASDMPVLNAATLEYLEKGLCEQRCWFNSLLLSSLGMAVAIDFVPAWGNRNSSHSWNTLLIDGQSHPFEPFWDHDRWKYKRIYNNRTHDTRWGKFRLPKVYRITYSNHIEGPLTDSRIKYTDIPPLFRNIKKKDVSAEYFDTTNLTVPLTVPVPPNTYYAYLCVFGYQEWHPVQWGKINGRQTTFKGMGRDMVYLPMYYTHGELTPASAPLYLDPKGKIHSLLPQGKTTLVLNGITGASYFDDNRHDVKYLAGSYFLGQNPAHPEQWDTLCRIPDSLYMNQQLHTVTFQRPYRYIRLIAPQDTFAAGEIRFYENENTPIRPRSIHTSFQPLNPQESLSALTDGYAATGYKGKISTHQSHLLDFDLGQPSILTSIGYTLYPFSQIYAENEYELRYWDNGWQVAGRQQGTPPFLTFKEVPAHTLYLLKNLDWPVHHSSERIFTYSNGEVHWQ